MRLGHAQTLWRASGLTMPAIDTPIKINLAVRYNIHTESTAAIYPAGDRDKSIDQNFFIQHVAKIKNNNA